LFPVEVKTDEKLQAMVRVGAAHTIDVVDNLNYPYMLFIQPFLKILFMAFLTYRSHQLSNVWSPRICWRNFQTVIENISRILNDSVHAARS
jgi:hypothetical protein